MFFNIIIIKKYAVWISLSAASSRLQVSVLKYAVKIAQKMAKPMCDI